MLFCREEGSSPVSVVIIIIKGHIFDVDCYVLRNCIHISLSMDPIISLCFIPLCLLRYVKNVYLCFPRLCVPSTYPVSTTCHHIFLFDLILSVQVLNRLLSTQLSTQCTQQIVVFIKRSLAKFEHSVPVQFLFSSQSRLNKFGPLLDTTNVLFVLFDHIQLSG